jgi:Cu(I)/Ag(I) efflux system periplasmic protein CusF
MKFGIQLAAALGIALAAPAFAQKAADDHSAHHGDAKAQSATLAEGEVRKVDKAAKRITIKHGPIPSLDMPAMTMVYRVKDAKLLTQVKAGDKIKFTAEKIGDNYTLTALEPAK